VSNVDFNILLNSVLGMNRYEVSAFGDSIHDHPNQIKLAGRNKLQRGVSFDIHDLAKQMKDKRSKALEKSQGR
jgi:hypothetical protein